jgi:hypothetical protein
VAQAAITGDTISVAPQQQHQAPVLHLTARFMHGHGRCMAQEAENEVHIQHDDLSSHDA